MKLRYLFRRELRFRPAGFLLAVVAVAAVAACLTGVHGFLAAHDRKTESLTAELETRASERMAQMRDDARIFSKSLGFNILLLPEAQDAGLFYAENRSTHFFTRAQVAALGRAKFATLNHLLPILRHKVAWPAYGGEVVLIGVEGEIYIKSPNFQKPIEESLEPGQIHIGDAIRQRLNLEVGAQVELLGESFTVHRLLAQKGNVDDISILMNLNDVQRLTHQTGKIGGVLALSCNCAAGELDTIRAELAPVLGGVEVIEFTTRALAREKARRAIGEGTQAEMDDIQSSRAALRDQLSLFSTVVVALIALTALVVLVVLGVMNTRERRVEAAMLRALGLSMGRLLSLFLAKALVFGICGGVLGVCAGVWVCELVFDAGSSVSIGFGLAVIGASTLFAVLAAWFPALHASRNDPALILNQE